MSSFYSYSSNPAGHVSYSLKASDVSKDYEVLNTPYFRAARKIMNFQPGSLFYTASANDSFASEDLLVYQGYTTNDPGTAFSHANVSRVDYLKEYDCSREKEDWLKRKLAALPDCALGVIRLSFRIIRVIFYTLPASILSLLLDEDTSLCARITEYRSYSLKAEIFSCIRDIEQILGSILTLINDSRGSFHQERSRFEKQMYEIHLQYLKAKFLEPSL